MKDRLTPEERIALNALAAGERRYPDDPAAAALHAAVHAAVSSSHRDRRAIEQSLGLGQRVLDDLLNNKPTRELKASTLARMIRDETVLGERGRKVLRAWMGALILDDAADEPGASAEMEALELADANGLAAALVRRAREADSENGARIGRGEATRICSAMSLVRAEATDVEMAARVEAGMGGAS